MSIPISSCKCGAPANPPRRVKGLKDGWVITCSASTCPATSQRVGKQSAIIAWNELAVRIN